MEMPGGAWNDGIKIREIHRDRLGLLSGINFSGFSSSFPEIVTKKISLPFFVRCAALGGYG